MNISFATVCLIPAAIFLLAPLCAEVAAPPGILIESPAPAPSEYDAALTEANVEPEETRFGILAKSGLGTVSSLLEDAESGDANFTHQDPTGLSTLLQGTDVFEGQFSFHLTNPRVGDGFPVEDTSMTLLPGIEVSEGTRLFFASKFALMTTSQIARLQLSTDGGNHFNTNLWSKSGLGVGVTSGSFEAVEIDLSAYAGQTVHLRFNLDFVGGSGYFQTTTDVGWLFDYIAIGGDAGLPIYSIGDPTDLEQYNLELINRSRADALAEADRLIVLSSSGGDPDVISAANFFGIQRPDIRTQYEWAIENGHVAASAQPLAFNAKLIEVARLHSQDMLNNNFQGHTSSNNPPTGANYTAGASMEQRLQASNYSYGWAGESVYSYAKSVLHAHAGFLIDWGESNVVGVGYNPEFNEQKMQNPAGHRFSNHNPNFQEIGIGYIVGSNSNVGPNLVTQNFASPGGGGQFITGVVIADRDGDAFYDPGEGIGDVVITAVPADGSTLRPAYRAVSSGSGGYALPVPGDGRYTLSFSHPEFGSASADCTLTAGENFKVDWIPAILKTASFGESSETPGKLEHRFLDAGISGTPKLQVSHNLSEGFTDLPSAVLSPRDDAGYRTFRYDKPATPSHFSRVVID